MFRKGKSADLSRQDSGQSGASGRLEVDHDHSKVYSGYLWAPSRSPSQSESINSLVLFGMTYCNDDSMMIHARRTSFPFHSVVHVCMFIPKAQ